MTEQSTDQITGFHAHVYYDAGSKETAARLRETVEARFAVRMGRWHDRPVGPHPCWSYQIAFEPEQFGKLVPWLALNRAGLDILVHPNTSDDIRDHTAAAMWLGHHQELNIEALREAIARRDRG